jgi:hypothetical protein
MSHNFDPTLVKPFSWRGFVRIINLTVHEHITIGWVRYTVHTEQCLKLNLKLQIASTILRYLALTVIVAAFPCNVVKTPVRLRAKWVYTQKYDDESP